MNLAALNAGDVRAFSSFFMSEVYMNCTNSKDDLPKEDPMYHVIREYWVVIAFGLGWLIFMWWASGKEARSSRSKSSPDKSSVRLNAR